MPDEEPVAAETAAEIVTTVRRGSALQLAEKNLTELRRRAGEIQSEMAALVAAKTKLLVPARSRPHWPPRRDLARSRRKLTQI